MHALWWLSQLWYLLLKHFVALLWNFVNVILKRYNLTIKPVILGALGYKNGDKLFWFAGVLDHGIFSQRFITTENSVDNSFVYGNKPLLGLSRINIDVNFDIT